MNSLAPISSSGLKNCCVGKTIKEFSPAKINIYLNIVGKYKNGFHKIESIFERISLCDVITISLCKDNGVTISCNDKSLENVNNLCVKSAQLILKKSKKKIGCHIDLKKQIPVGAGLGGGSSNAASVLIGLNHLLGLKLKKEELFMLLSKLLTRNELICLTLPEFH